ncbi:MAG: glycosyltransferase, partial [Cyanobacteria bacterium P01_F01_bin.13]
MKFDFAVVGVGSTGDIRPLAAIAKGLQDAGYSIRFITHENFRSLAEGLDLPFFPIAGDYRKFLQSPEGIKIIKGEVPPWEELAQIKRERVLQLKQTLAAAEGARAIIAGPLSLWASNITEKLRIPIIVASPFPLQRTAYFPVLQFGKGVDPTINPVQKWANVTSYSLIQILKGLSDRKITNEFRQSIGLKNRPVVPRYDPEAAKMVLILHQYSKCVVPSPPDWENARYQVETVGYCFLDDDRQYESPQSLVDFINRDERPLISLGFGSMPIGEPAETYELISQAISKAQVRCIFLLGWGNDKGSELFKQNPDIYLANQIPHRWLFSRMSAVVHHCGAGTTAASIRAGVPVVPVPFF